MLGGTVAAVMARALAIVLIGRVAALTADWGFRGTDLSSPNRTTARGATVAAVVGSAAAVAGVMASALAADGGSSAAIMSIGSAAAVVGVMVSALTADGGSSASAAVLFIDSAAVDTASAVAAAGWGFRGSGLSSPNRTTTCGVLRAIQCGARVALRDLTSSTLSFIL